MFEAINFFLGIKYLFTDTFLEVLKGNHLIFDYVYNSIFTLACQFIFSFLALFLLLAPKMNIGLGLSSVSERFPIFYSLFSCTFLMIAIIMMISVDTDLTQLFSFFSWIYFN